jgi:peptidoglycan hydrolase CwlO-like protein
MKNKKMAEKPFNMRKEFRHLGVIIEGVHDEVKLVAEQYGDIKGDVTDIKGDITDIKGEVADIKGDITDIKGEIGHIKNTLDVHTEAIGELSVDMQGVKRNIEIMKEDVEFIKAGFKKKVDIEECSALERRVIVLEKRR